MTEDASPAAAYSNIKPKGPESQCCNRLDRATMTKPAIQAATNGLKALKAWKISQLLLGKLGSIR